MKNALLLCLFFASLAAVPSAAQPAEPAEPDAPAQANAPEHPDGVGGVWYVQQTQGEWTPANEEIRLEFRDDGLAHYFENGVDEEDPIAYTVDEEQSVIRLVEPDIGMTFSLAYVQFDDVMILTIRLPEELQGMALEDQDMEIVLSRRPEGNEDHQRERAAVTFEGMDDEVGDDGFGDANEAGEELDADAQSLRHMRSLTICIFAYDADHGSCPATLGDLAEYMGGLEEFFQPGQAVEVPEAYREGMFEENAERSAWVDAHTGYAYIGGDAASLAFKNEQWDAPMMFALPLFEGMESIAIGFADGHAERLAYEDADALIAEHTGRDLMGWMEDMGREQLPALEEAEGEAGDAGDAAGDAAQENADAAARPARDGGHFHADGTYHGPAEDDAADGHAAHDDHDHPPH